MLPAREARHRYNGLKQTGSVKQFAREQIQLVRELEDTPFHPGGSVFDDFIRGLKPDVQTFVQDHAPSGWWIDIKDLYQKALDFEMNGIASDRARARGAEQVDELDCSSDSDSEQVDDDLLEHDPDHDDQKRVRTPSSVWKARKDPKTYYRCRKPGHLAKDCNAALD